MTAAEAATSADEFLRRCLASYHGGGPTEDEAAEDSVRRVAEHLNASRSGAAVCLICLELLKRKDAVWSCADGCCDTTHLVCIQAWARQQLQAAAAKHDSVQARAAIPAPIWACPKCRCEYGASDMPTEYRCHCGKVTDPSPDLWLPPHTCGDTCRRELPCGHTCVLLCHPGPCPACPLQVESSCFCGKEQTQKRCHSSRFSCGRLCGKRHACGHRCPLKCHSGPCPSCQLSSRRSCQCGAEAAVVPCAVDGFHCQQPCRKPLACGRHRCEAVCHAGDCKPCPFTGARSCPCGKKDSARSKCPGAMQSTFEGLSCEDGTPTCGGTCDKRLPCGQHKCAERCHTGPCSDVCRIMTAKACSCGRLQKAGPCCEMLRCERKCQKLRSCGRHTCRRRCCNGNCPPCQEECGRLLKCGNHRCKATCHSGACLPCTRELRVSCACGDTSYRLPCGWEARARPPVCPRPCPVPCTCRHAHLLPAHKCHFGPCPACLHPCGTVLGCGHGCSAAGCHDATPPAVPEFRQPAPPQQSALEEALVDQRSLSASAEAVQVAEQLQSEGPSHCPACPVEAKTWCQGLHSQLPHPCSDISFRSCGQPCGRLLGCGSHFTSREHRCSRPCHPLTQPDGSCERMPPGTAAEPGCETCALDCGRQRTCGHACKAKCHSGECALCQVEVNGPCYCGKSSLTHTCHALSEDPEALLRCEKQCLRSLPGCPHLCESRCHPGACPGTGSCKQEVTVRCHCRRLKEKWRCADVQAALEAAGDGSRHDGTAAPRLLSCDALCKAAQKPAGSRQADKPAGPTATDPSAAVPAPPAAESRRRQRGAGRRDGGAQVVATGPSVVEQLSQHSRKLLRRLRKAAIPVCIVTIGMISALVLYLYA